MRTLTFSISSNVKLSNVVGGSSLEPDLLPDARARAIEDVAGIIGLLANRNNLRVGRVINKDEPDKQQLFRISTVTVFHKIRKFDTYKSLLLPNLTSSVTSTLNRK